MSELAEELGLSRHTVTREITRAENQGLVPGIRDRLLQTLDKVPAVYARILDATPEELHKHSRGFKLQLDTANSMNDGLGVFKKESTKQVTNTLALIAAEQAPEGRWGENPDGTRLRPRVAFQPESVEGEIVPPEDDPQP